VGSSTFSKRQKEQARQEKQRLKAERRAQRKNEKSDAPGGGPPIDFSAMVRFEPETTPEDPENDAPNA
jgi:hypothetical protein